MIYLQILLVFMKIGALAFGGAYASIGLVQQEIVEVQKWMSYTDFTNLLALDEVTPGPMILNSATFVGMHMAGLPGAIVATIGAMIPSWIICFILIKLYEKYKEVPLLETIIGFLKCMSIALIVSTTFTIFCNISKITTNINYINCLLLIVAYFVLKKYKLNPLLVMLGCGTMNLLISLL